MLLIIFAIEIYTGFINEILSKKRRGNYATPVHFFENLAYYR